MKAVVMRSVGGPEVLELAQLPEPQPQAEEVLIRVCASGVNPIDYKIRSGRQANGEVELPFVPGCDVSGVVEAVGRGVSGLKAGDAVYALLGGHGGGYAEWAVARENETALKPVTLGYSHAAAVPLAATTAWQALFDHGGLRAGQRVLVHGGAGGVGHFAVQLAKCAGATVITTAGGEDFELLRGLGADQIIDFHYEAFEYRVKDVDLVIDLIGGETQERSWLVLKDGGALISTIEAPEPGKAAALHARAGVFMARPRHDQLMEIARLIDDRKVRVVLQRIYALNEAARAQDELEHDHAAGKRVLITSGGGPGPACAGPPMTREGVKG